MIATRVRFVTLLLIASLACAMQPCAAGSASARNNPGANTVSGIVPVEDSTTQRVQTDGRGAHLGRELCGFKDSAIARYKAALRRSLGDPVNFDYAWQYGWGRADATLLEYQTLHSTDPQDYVIRVRRICATLRRIGERVEKSSDKAPNKPTNQPSNQPSNNAVDKPASAQ